MVTWAMSTPPATSPKEIEVLLREDFRLVKHHPKAFLFKFLHPHHCDEAVKEGYVKRRGIDIRLIRWRSLSSILRVTLFFSGQALLGRHP
ncbi:hypothetical protein U9M48_019776 [Paspalum notatum var. saurae]|uniref:Uncharacterized protein n=1 Tax=Paspalum notatum var. saurae TaxID=547442 RepID=A0AAQ3WR96_PASNO